MRSYVSLVALLVALSGGCAIGYGYRDVPARTTCLAPEAAFTAYVSSERNDPTAASAGRCETGQTEDIGDKFTICPVRTSRHGVIHKRLPTRACWR